MKKKTSGRNDKRETFVLDIQTEPLPARFIPLALEQMRANCSSMLTGKLDFSSIAVKGTLRHLVLVVEAVAHKGADTVLAHKGPKLQAWKNPDGTYTQAAEGFARKHGLPASKLEAREGVLYAVVSKKGESADRMLREFSLQLLTSLQFPKSMVWESTGFRFGRPIRAITALLGSKVIPFDVAGIKSSRALFTHPAMRNAATPLKKSTDHERVMLKGSVILDPVERRTMLLHSLRKAAASVQGTPDLDESLLEETVFMVEHPTAILGRLQPKYMDLPASLLTTVMKKQLKFFPVLDKSGTLLPFFIGVRDGLTSGNDLVRDGFQRVLDARFNDASFFFARDIASTLESKLPALKHVTYQQSLGSSADKAARVEALSAWIGEHIRPRITLDEMVCARSAHMAYADLVTDVVKEFPELQGTMGGVYARKDGLDERTALAIEQFYFPIAAKSPVPLTLEGAVVSLAGKLDSITGCFFAGLIPTGSADPYGLRRQAVGLIRIILEKQLPINLDRAIEQALTLQPDTANHPSRASGPVSDFIWGRLQTQFEEMGFEVNEIRSIREGAMADLPDAFRRLAAIHAVRKNSEFSSLAATFKRAANALKQIKDVNLPDINGAFLQEPSEIELLSALEAAESDAQEKIMSGDYEGALTRLAVLRPILDRFFASVMVMVDNEELRNQRLALLSKLVRAFKRIADLAEI